MYPEVCVHGSSHPDWQWHHPSDMNWPTALMLKNWLAFFRQERHGVKMLARCRFTQGCSDTKELSELSHFSMCERKYLAPNGRLVYPASPLPNIFARKSNQKRSMAIQKIYWKGSGIFLYTLSTTFICPYTCPSSIAVPLRSVKGSILFFSELFLHWILHTQHLWFILYINEVSEALVSTTPIVIR